LTGAEIVPIDIQPMLDAAALLYGGAFVAERYVAVGAHIRAHTDLIGTDLDPTVAQIILDAAMPTAANYFADRERLDFLAARAAEAMSGLNALLTPTTTAHPTIAEVQAGPVAVNSRLGRYTSFANLLDMAALAVPAGTAGGLPFGVMFTGPAGSDDRLAQIAARCGQAPVDLLVIGAHLSGQPLNHELLAAGGTLIGQVTTADRYRLFALDTRPPKPGLVRVGDDYSRCTPGASIPGEVWRLPPVGFARFMADLTAPMAIGLVQLDDGRHVLGFLCEPAAVTGAQDITSYGSWRAWRTRSATAPPTTR
jgi:allophanate hydrolase